MLNLEKKTQYPGVAKSCNERPAGVSSAFATVLNGNFELQELQFVERDFLCRSIEF